MTRAMTPSGRHIEVVDTQVHANLIGGVEDMIAAMDAVGIHAMVIDEWAGWDAHGRRLPNRPSPDGTLRYDAPAAAAAVAACPQRIARTAWVDHRACNLRSVLRDIAADPHQLCLRIVARAGSGDVGRLRDGDYDRLLSAAQEHDVPVMICLSRVDLAPRFAATRMIAKRFDHLQLIVDHCGVLPLSDRDRERGLACPETLGLASELADLANIAVKWSQAPTLSASAFPHADTLPALRLLVDAFGATRVMWASDATTVASHHTWAEALHVVLDAQQFSDDDLALILGGTANRILRWPSFDGEVPSKDPTAWQSQRHPKRF